MSVSPSSSRKSCTTRRTATRREPRAVIPQSGSDLPPPPPQRPGRRPRRPAREAARPAHEGRDHAGGVRHQEGRAAQQAVVRVVSLVPSVTETLLAWGITPVAVTRFCEHPELVHVGGTKDPDVAAIVTSRAGSRRRERRGEPQGGFRRARSARASTIHVVRIETVDDVAPGDGGARGRRRHVGACVHPASAPVATAPRVRADLASSVDDDERRDLRVVGARSPRRDQRRSRTRRLDIRR